MLILCKSSTCKAWFRSSRKSLPLPHRPPEMNGFVLDQATEANGPRRQAVGWGRSGLSISEESLRKLRNERRSFKNVSIYVTELPATPLCRMLVREVNAAMPNVSASAVTSSPTKRHHIKTGMPRKKPLSHPGRQPRHDSDWLFGGFSVSKTAKRLLEDC